MNNNLIFSKYNDIYTICGVFAQLSSTFHNGNFVNVNINSGSMHLLKTLHTIS